MDALAAQLESVGGPVTVTWKTSRSSPDTSSMDALSGTWRLIYSSGFNSGSLGGRRPGPPAALVPTVLGQVYQVIDGRAVRAAIVWAAGCAVVDGCVLLLCGLQSVRLKKSLTALLPKRPNPHQH